MPRQKQKTPMGSLSLLLGIALATLVVVGLVFIFRSVPKILVQNENTVIAHLWFNRLVGRFDLFCEKSADFPSLYCLRWL